MSLASAFKTNKSKINDGVTVSLPQATNADGTVPYFVLARMHKSNKSYSKALEEKTRPYRRQMELGVLSEETSKQIMLEVFSETVVKSWGNVQNESGDVIPFSPANVINLMQEYDELYDFLQIEARNFEYFKDDQIEAETKN